MSARAASAPGAGVLDRLQVLRSAPTPLRGAPAATWTPSPRTGVGPLRVPGPGLQPSSHDTTTTRTDPAGSTLARPDFGPKDGVHLNGPSDEPIGSRDRATLLTIIAALASHAKVDISQPSKAGGIIEAMTRAIEARVAGRTIEKQLRLFQDTVERRGFSKPVGSRERATLLTIIAALASHAKVDIGQPSKAGGTIEAMTLEIKARVASQTIEEHLRGVPDALERRRSSR